MQNRTHEMQPQSSTLTPCGPIRSTLRRHHSSHKPRRLRSCLQLSRFQTPLPQRLHPAAPTNGARGGKQLAAALAGIANAHMPPAGCTEAAAAASLSRAAAAAAAAAAAPSTPEAAATGSTIAAAAVGAITAAAAAGANTAAAAAAGVIPAAPAAAIGTIMAAVAAAAAGSTATLSLPGISAPGSAHAATCPVDPAFTPAPSSAAATAAATATPSPPARAAATAAASAAASGAVGCQWTGHPPALTPDMSALLLPARSPLPADRCSANAVRAAPAAAVTACIARPAGGNPSGI